MRADRFNQPEIFFFKEMRKRVVQRINFLVLNPQKILAHGSQSRSQSFSSTCRFSWVHCIYTFIHNTVHRCSCLFCSLITNVCLHFHAKYLPGAKLPLRARSGMNAGDILFSLTFKVIHKQMGTVFSSKLKNWTKKFKTKTTM